jgi:hypothetical protein
MGMNGELVFVGWEMIPGTQERQFVAKVRFVDGPPPWPLRVAWDKTPCEITIGDNPSKTDEVK